MTVVTLFYASVVDWILSCGHCAQKLRQMSMRLQGLGLFGKVQHLSPERSHWKVFTGTSIYNILLNNNEVKKIGLHFILTCPCYSVIQGRPVNFYYQFYFNTINLKCYTKSDRPTKTTILLHLLFCSKPFKPVLMKIFCFIPGEILSETSRRHCVLNSATSRKKESVHIESSDI